MKIWGKRVVRVRVPLPLNHDPDPARPTTTVTTIERLRGLFQFLDPDHFHRRIFFAGSWKCYRGSPFDLPGQNLGKYNPHKKSTPGICFKFQSQCNHLNGPSSTREIPTKSSRLFRADHSPECRRLGPTTLAPTSGVPGGMRLGPTKK